MSIAQAAGTRYDEVIKGLLVIQRVRLSRT